MPAESDFGQGRAKPPKAILKPPQSLLVGNQLGTQSHLNATPKPHQSYPSALPYAGAVYAHCHAMQKAIYKAYDTRRGFFNAILAPVHSRQESRFGVRQTVWIMMLTFGTVAVMRLLLAH